MAAPQELTASQPTCRKHKAPLGLYCVEMEELACEVCKEVSGHKKYRFWMVQEAAASNKVVPRSSLGILVPKVKGHGKALRVFSEMAKHLKIQAQQTEREIKDEFEKLHRFLREEEEARIAALREEAEQKKQALKEKIQRITKEMSFVSDTIKTIEQELQADDISFLQNYKTTLDKTWLSLQDQLSQPEGFFVKKLAELRRSPGKVLNDAGKRVGKPHREAEVITGGLIDVNRHLGNLKYIVWRKMLGIVKYAPVTLDPNTAAPCLSLSEGLTCIQYCTDNPQLPDNPERFTSQGEMLGSQSFTSGRHCWEVEVGENSNWAVGVARQSVLRKEETIRPRRGGGIVALSFAKGKYHIGRAHIPVQSNLQRVRVELDWNSRFTTFSDPAHNCYIAATKLTFTEPVFPYFYSSCEEHPLKIAPEKVRVSVEAPEHENKNQKEESGFFSGLVNWYKN